MIYNTAILPNAVIVFICCAVVRISTPYLLTVADWTIMKVHLCFQQFTWHVRNKSSWSLVTKSTWWFHDDQVTDWQTHDNCQCWLCKILNKATRGGCFFHREFGPVVLNGMVTSRSRWMCSSDVLTLCFFFFFFECRSKILLFRWIAKTVVVSLGNCY